MASDTTINAFLAQGTDAERLAFTPTPPTPAAGPDNGYFFYTTDTGFVWAWNTSGAAWVKVGTGSVTNTGTLTLHALILGNGTADVKALGSLGTTTTVLHGNAAGDPTFAAVSLTADVSGDLPFSSLVQASGASKLVGRGSASGAGDFQELTLGTGLSLSGTTLSASLGAAVPSALGITIDGAGSTITTGVKGFLSVPFACTITGVTLLSTDASATAGSIVVDIWKDTYANYPPTIADTITSATPPTLSSANKSVNTTLTSWTTAISAGDVLGFNVNSATTVTRVTLVIAITIP